MERKWNGTGTELERNGYGQEQTGTGTERLRTGTVRQERERYGNERITVYIFKLK